MRLVVELTPVQLDRLAHLRVSQVGRVNPRKAWTDQERKFLSREWIELAIAEATDTPPTQRIIL